ncbi:hypothetical protein VTN77DRAFT_3345 [Rasamsonia byssochlamydoides]|uniref:uncharacterized protein n=1 Tax=Rasamsonia byssochlamydoides TaxID=89139 RepID=UPI003743BA26
MTKTEVATTTVSGLTLCPSRTVNPTYTPAASLPRNYTWGCAPGTLCRPPKPAGCNFEAGPPADTYYCSPDECVPSPQLLPPQFWGEPIASDQIGKFNVSPGYFNLDPEAFGLGYDVFAFPLGRNLAKRHILFDRFHRFLSFWPRQQTGLSRIPGVCYDECNDCMLEVQSSGKTPGLCQNGSAFNTFLSDCHDCIQAHTRGSGGSGTISDHIPDFQQFLSYCETEDDEPGPSPSQAESSSSSTATVAQSTPSSPTGAIADDPSDGKDGLSTSTSPQSTTSTSPATGPTDLAPLDPTSSPSPSSSSLHQTQNTTSNGSRSTKTPPPVSRTYLYLFSIWMFLYMCQ